MLFIKMSSNWVHRSILVMACLALVISACGTSVALPTNTAIPSPKPSLSSIPTPTVTQSLTSLPRLITNGTLAYLDFNPSGSGKSRIRFIDVVSRETRDIEFDCYLCDAFSFSPDGAHIALAGVKEFSAHMKDGILLLDLESGKIKQFESSPDCMTSVSWSPDGKYFLYTNDYDCKRLGSNIRIVDLATDTTRNITNTREQEFGPMWSPNGKYIAYGFRELTPGGVIGADGYSRTPEGYLWLMDSSGNNSRQISDMPTGYHFQISWSPDSTMIAHSSPMACGVIYITNIRTNETKKFFDTDGCATNPAWSPDGKAIAVLVTTYTPGTHQTKDWTIYLVSVVGNDAVPVIHGRQGEEPPLYLEWVPANLDANTPLP